MPMRVYGLLGKSLEHSFSAEYFRKKFDAEHITDACYRLFPVSNAGDFSTVIEKYRPAGLNVTIPYKQSVLELGGEMSDEVKECGAANTLFISYSDDACKISFFNTDVFGFYTMVKPLLQPHHSSALILGNGGAARAVACALKMLGISYAMVARRPVTGMISYADITSSVLESALLVIQATPLGMYPKVEGYPMLPYHAFGRKHLAVDLVYNPSETVFMKRAASSGATVVNGLAMLYAQAERSWEIWNDPERFMRV